MVYYDRQNVHNSTINESVIVAARALIEQMVAVVTFDERYNFKVFRDDTVTSVTTRLASVLRRFPEDVTILGRNRKQELQPKMTYRLAKGAKSTSEELRFKPEEVFLYMQVMGLQDFIFPDNVIRDGEQGKRLEEVFIATNRHLIDVFENAVDKDKELPLYLDMSGIPNALMIWLEREEISKNLYAVLDNGKAEKQDVEELLDEIFEDLFSDMEMGSLIRNIKTSSVRNIQLIDLLNAVWKFIHTKQGETFTEMKKRLREELLEAKGVCSSGICAHLVSVIQGYFDEDKHPELKIKMALEDELAAALTQNINALAMELEVDPVMEPGAFKRLIDKYVDANAQKIMAPYDAVRRRGLSKQMITTLAYKVYRIYEEEEL